MYLDLGGKSIIKNLRNGETCILEFYKRGWSGHGYKFEGEVYTGKKECVYKIEGKWNDKIYLINNQGDKELAWQKRPYHELADRMYGMSHFMINANYFPKRLQSVVAPTDTRRRPDQRALEEGDMKLASSEKNRLEEKQRAIKRYREKFGVEPKQAYFYEKKNDLDGVNYWLYNGKYFEHDREK